eukprot:12985839-Alexandrium_andersonii.AAC.1
MGASTAACKIKRGFGLRAAGQPGRAGPQRSNGPTQQSEPQLPQWPSLYSGPRRATCRRLTLPLEPPTWG